MSILISAIEAIRSYWGGVQDVAGVAENALGDIRDAVEQLEAENKRLRETNDLVLRLFDYIRMELATGTIGPKQPTAIAWRDVIQRNGYYADAPEGVQKELDAIALFFADEGLEFDRDAVREPSFVPGAVRVEPHKRAE